MLLYDMSVGMNPRRMRIFLAEKGLMFTTRQIDGVKRENLTPEFRALNSIGKVPVLELDDGTLLTESVSRYVDPTH